VRLSFIALDSEKSRFLTRLEKTGGGMTCVLIGRSEWQVRWMGD